MSDFGFGKFDIWLRGFSKIEVSRVLSKRNSLFFKGCRKIKKGRNDYKSMQGGDG